MILDYVQQNPLVVTTIATVLIIAAVTAVTVFVKTHSWRETLYALMLRAEKAWTGGEFGQIPGGAVMQIVVKQFLLLLPAWARPFVTEAMVAGWAQGLYDGAKDYLDDGKFNDSVKERVTGIANTGK